MIKETLRIVAVFLLLMIIIMDDFPFYNKLKDPSTQLFLAIIVLVCIYYDTTFGFIMGLVLLLIYYEIYKKIIISHENDVTEKMSNETTSANGPKDNQIVSTNKLSPPVKLDYISEAHLLAAQNNIFDMANMNTEITSVGFANNADVIYGAQGLDLGYDKDDKYHMW